MKNRRDPVGGGRGLSTTSVVSPFRDRDRHQRVGQDELTLRMAGRQHRTRRDADDPLGDAPQQEMGFPLNRKRLIGLVLITEHVRALPPKVTDDR